MRKSVTKAKDVTYFPFSFLTDFLMTSVTEIFSENNNNNSIRTQLITFSELSHCTTHYVKKTWLLMQKGNKTKYLQSTAELYRNSTLQLHCTNN